MNCTVTSMQSNIPAGSTTDMLSYFLCFQVCSTGVDEVLMKDEFDRLSKALVQGATTYSPPLPLTTIVVQVSLSSCFGTMISVHVSLQEFQVLSFSFFVKLS